MLAAISVTVLAIRSHRASQYEVKRRGGTHFTVMKKALSKQEPVCSCGEELL